MKDSKLGDTPIAKGDKFSLKHNGELIYAQVCTRLDIAFVVFECPGMQHWKVIKHVIRYLRRTKGYMLTYRKSKGLEIIGYSDSDFARCQDSKCSTYGYIYMLAGGAIFWKFVKKTLIAPSTIAIEFVACFDASNHSSK
ncbi:hypothetical protein CR513_02188, partial [Mucuna pruriens]